MLTTVSLLFLCLGGLVPGDLLLSTDLIGKVKDELVLDVRPAEAFEKGHIPGSAHLDQASLSEERDGVPNELKHVDALAPLLAQAGLDADRHIIIYTEMADASDFKNATRMFWILEYLSYEKVSILDGGYAKWVAEGRPVETGPSKVESVKTGKVSARPRGMLLAEYETVAEMAASGEGVLVDCRAPEEYAGLTKKNFVAKKGNIPHATNVPAQDFIDPATMLLKPAAELSQLIAPVKADKDAPIVTYCNSGRDATVGYFTLRMAGHDRVAVYDGSMAEWASKESLPVGGAPAK